MRCTIEPFRSFALAGMLAGGTPSFAQDVINSDADDVVVERPLDPKTRQAIESRANMHPWDRYVRGFREGHNFALSAGVSSGAWQVNHFGSIDHGTFESSGAFARFQYTFHLPIYAGFGYMLGSAFGYHYESVDERRSFKPVPAYIFPGVAGGLVYNFNPVFRAGAMVEASLERHGGIEERDKIDDRHEIFVTMQAYDVVVFVDIFYELSWALRFEGHRRDLQYGKPFESEGYPVDASIRKEDSWAGLGLVYHLL